MISIRPAAICTIKKSAYNQDELYLFLIVKAAIKYSWSQGKTLSYTFRNRGDNMSTAIVEDNCRKLPIARDTAAKN